MTQHSLTLSSWCTTSKYLSGIHIIRLSKIGDSVSICTIDNVNSNGDIKQKIRCEKEIGLELWEDLCAFLLKNLPNEHLILPGVIINKKAFFNFRDISYTNNFVSTKLIARLRHVNQDFEIASFENDKWSNYYWLVFCETVEEVAGLEVEFDKKLEERPPKFLFLPEVALSTRLLMDCIKISWTKSTNCYNLILLLSTGDERTVASFGKDVWPERWNTIVNFLESGNVPKRGESIEIVD